MVPLTVTVELLTLAPSDGELTLSGSDPGIPRATYRALTMRGVSRSCPVLRARARRAYWAWAQVSGLAESAGWPGRKPIDAVAGSVP